MIQHLGENVHVMAVCQPTVPVLAAVSLMHQRKDKLLPASMILMGGPIDTRRNPTTVNEMATERGTDWFKRHVIVRVPLPNAGFMRKVYPGFLQLTGFMTMNLDRHVDAHRELFWHLVEGDGDSAEKHEEFYDEYLSVMDLTAEFYLQTVDRVFVKQALPKGEFTYRDQLIEPASITETALMTVEGEKDDISGIGQSEAAHELCTSLPRGNARPSPAGKGRPLRRVQRLPVPRSHRAAHCCVHAQAQFASRRAFCHSDSWQCIQVALTTRCHAFRARRQ